MAAGSKGPVAVAVSGGSDSLALLHLAHDWALRAGRSLLVLTVDHGLRPESAREAAFTIEQANALGHDAQGLEWRPGKRSQAAARRARHALLANACREAGAELLLLGHTRTDVEETLLMRLARPSTLAGAAGPQPVSVSPVWPDGRGLLLGRPLIEVPRAMLKAELEARGQAWVDDPGNLSDTYERGRIRRLTARLDAGRLTRITCDAMRLRAREDAALAAGLRDAVAVDPSGLVTLDTGRLPAQARIAIRMLSILLQCSAGSDRPATPDALESLLADLHSGGPQSRLTLGGAWLQRRGPALLVGRDPGEMQAGWHGDVWDGRYVRDPQGEPAEDLPFLVRHGVPPGEGWREIVSDRLARWESALSLGAVLGAQLTGARAGEDANLPTRRLA